MDMDGSGSRTTNSTQTNNFIENSRTRRIEVLINVLVPWNVFCMIGVLLFESYI